MNKHFLNEKGITLTELLAALSLFAVVSALVMTVLFNVFLNSENISDNAQLRQDANLLISTLRSHYNQGNFEVRLNDSNSLLIDGQEVNSSMTSSIDELELINGENSIPPVNESMTVTADGTPLSIKLTLKNEAQQTYSISTTIEKPTELEIALQVFEVIEEPPPIVPPGDFIEKLPGCDSYDKDIKYVSNGSYQLIPDGCGDITIEGHVRISNPNPHNVVEMKHNTARFIVEKNLFVDSVFHIDNYHPMDVGGDALFDTKLELKNIGKFIATNIHAVDGDHNNNGIVVRERTRLEARESIVVAKRFHILGQPFEDHVIDKRHVIIGKNLIANTVEAVNHSTININGSASISNKLLATDRSELKIGKNLIIDGDLEMYDNAEITVEGNARIDGDLILGGNSNLTITGNLAIKGEVKQDDDGNNGTLDVGGITNFSNGKPDWLNVED